MIYRIRDWSNQPTSKYMSKYQETKGKDHLFRIETWKVKNPIFHYTEKEKDTTTV